MYKTYSILAANKVSNISGGKSWAKKDAADFLVTIVHYYSLLSFSSCCSAMEQIIAVANKSYVNQSAYAKRLVF
jgi:hypothetical protein